LPKDGTAAGEDAAPETPPPIESAALIELRRRLSMLTTGRVALVTVLLAATALIEWQARIQTSASAATEVTIYRLVAAVCGMSLIYVVALKLVSGRRQVVALGYVQLCGDAVFAAALVFITGGTASVFTFFFSLTIVLASILLLRTGAITLATLSSLLLLVIGMTEMGILDEGALLADMRLVGVGPLDPVGTEEQSITTITKNLIVNVVAFYAIAVLASYLADQLRRTGERIQESELSLEDLRALHRNIVASIQSGLITVNQSLQITFFNSEAERITGYQAREILHQDITRYFSDLKQIFLNEDKIRGQTVEVTSEVLRGQLCYVRWTISPLLDSRGVGIGHVLIFDDETDVRHMQEQIKRDETFASLGRVAAAIAHEIRNPLASISGSIQLLRSTLDLEEDDRRLMEIVSRETASLNAWITDFLLYARPRAGKRIAVDIASLISDSLTVLAHDEQTTGIDVVFDPSARAITLGDPTYLKQVIWNIVNNAVQAMDGEGRLAIEIAGQHDDRGAFHRVSFQDSGPGIEDDVLDRLFEPFFTTKASGTGLGLATVYRIVGEHGGHMSVETDADGTIFHVDLPVREAG
jgi:two-component system sensor histidine kinase PilS (NtrC family)